jgi:hypothetical protein
MFRTAEALLHSIQLQFRGIASRRTIMGGRHPGEVDRDLVNAIKDGIYGALRRHRRDVTQIKQKYYKTITWRSILGHC